MRFLPLLALVLVAASCDTASDEASGPRKWSRCETLEQIQDKRIDESSGICASPTEAGIYYTHNDSGDSARFFKFDRSGKVLATYDVSNAKAVDWEDCASAKIGGKPYLFFGDIGDNAGVRKSIVVYRIPEPDPHPLTPSPLSGDRSGKRLRGIRREETGEGELVRADRIYTLQYPDEPHNAETLMVDPRSNDVLIVTKAASKPSAVFVLAHAGASGRSTLTKLGELQVGGDIRESRLVTGGDIAPDGKHVVLRTYMAAWEFEYGGDWFKQTPTRIQTNFEFGGEGICYSRDGKSLLTTSEGVPCQLSEAKLGG